MVVALNLPGPTAVLRWGTTDRTSHPGTCEVDDAGGLWLAVHVESDRVLWAHVHQHEAAPDCARRVSQAVAELLRLDREAAR